MKRTAARIAAFALSLTGFALAPAPASAQLCQVYEGVYTGAYALDCVADGVEHSAPVTIELIDDHGKFQLNPGSTAVVTATTFAASGTEITSNYTLYARPLATIELTGGSATNVTGNFYAVTVRQHQAAATTDVEITVLRTGLTPEFDCPAGLGDGTYAANSPIPDCHFRFATNTPDAATVAGTLANFIAFTSPDLMPLLPAGPDGMAITPAQDKVFYAGVQTITIASLLENGFLGREDGVAVTVYDYINDVYRFTISGVANANRAVDVCQYPEHDAGATEITVVENTGEVTTRVNNVVTEISTSLVTIRSTIDRATGCSLRPVRSHGFSVTVLTTVENGVTTTFTSSTPEVAELPAGRQVTLRLLNHRDLFGPLTSEGGFVTSTSVIAVQSNKFNHQEQGSYLLTFAQSSGGARLSDIKVRVEIANRPPYLLANASWPSSYETNSGQRFVLAMPGGHELFADVEGTTLSYAASVVTPANGTNWLVSDHGDALAGVPPAAGDYVFDLRASDGTQTSTGAFRFTVVAADSTPTVDFAMSGRQTLELLESADFSGGPPVGITFPATFRGGVRILGESALLNKSGLPFTIVNQTSLYVLRVKQAGDIITTTTTVGNVMMTNTVVLPVTMDYEAKPAYTLTIQAFSAQPSGAGTPPYAIGTITLTVTDANDNQHTINLSGLRREFDEGSLAAGEIIDTGYRVTVTDADSAARFSHEYDFSVPALTVEGGRVLAAGPGVIDYEAGHRVVTLVVRDAQPYNEAGDRRAATVNFMLGLRDVSEGRVSIVKDPPVYDIYEFQTVYVPFSDFFDADGEEVFFHQSSFPNNIRSVVDYDNKQFIWRKQGFAGPWENFTSPARYSALHKDGGFHFWLTIRLHAGQPPRQPRAVVRENSAVRLPLVVTEPVYLHSSRDAISYHDMGQVLATNDVLLAETAASATIQLPPHLYNQQLLRVVNDERFAFDYSDLQVDGAEQRIRGLYAKPGAVFDPAVSRITLTIEIKDGVTPGLFTDPHMRSQLSLQDRGFSVLNKSYPNLRFATRSRGRFEIELDMFAPGVAVEGAQASFGAQDGVVDTGFTLVATNIPVDDTRSDALRFASSSPAIVLPSGFTRQRLVPIMMDAGLAAASPDLTRDHCGALALPVTLHAETAGDAVRSNPAVVSIRVAPGPARLRGRAAGTLSAGVTRTATPTGYELACLAPDVEAFFTDSRFTLESGAGPTRRIMLKAGAVMAAGEQEAVVTVSHRQGGGAQTGSAVLRLPVDPAGPELRALAPHVPGRYTDGDLFMLQLGRLFAGGAGGRSYQVSIHPAIDFTVAAGLLQAPLTAAQPNVGDVRTNPGTGSQYTVTVAAAPYEIEVVASDQAGARATSSFRVLANATVNAPTDTAFPSIKLFFDQARYRIKPGATVRTTTYIHRPPDINYHGLAPLQSGDFVVTILDAGVPGLAFTLGAEQANEQMVQVLDDRFGVDFSDVSFEIETDAGSATNTVQWTQGIYIKPGVVFPGGPVSLTILVRGQPEPRNFSSPELRTEIARAALPGYGSDPFELLAGNRAGVATAVLGIESEPQLAVTGEQAIIDPLERGWVDTGLTLVKSFHRGRLIYVGDNMRLPGHEAFYSPSFNIRRAYKGEEANEFPITVDMSQAHRALRGAGCGMYELPLTIRTLQRIGTFDQNISFGSSVAFTLTLGKALGDELPNVSGAALTRGPADVEADFATGLAFECVGPDFSFSSTNDAFALAGAGRRRGIVVKAGVANDASLTTRITYAARAGGQEASFDLTIGTLGTLAVEGPATPPAVAEADRPRLWVNGTLAAIPGLTASGDFHLEGGGAAIEYGGIGAFLQKGFTLTTYHEAAGATVYATTAFDAAAYNERLVQVDDDRFGIDLAGYAAANGRQSFRGLYVKEGAVFSEEVVTVTLKLNSGAYLKDFATGALRRRIDAGGVTLLDPQIAGAGFANTATAEAAVTVWVAPRAFVSGTQVTIEIGTGNTSVVDTGLQLSVARAGGISIDNQHPALKIGSQGGISVIRGSIDLAAHATPRGCGIYEMPITARIVSDENAAAYDEVSFNFTLYNASAVNANVRPEAVAGAVAEVAAGTLTAQIPTGYAFRCAHSGFNATFSNDAFELIGSGPRREIALKNGATITAPGATTRVVYRQDSGNSTRHTVTVSIPAYGTLAWTGPSQPGSGGRAGVSVDPDRETRLDEFALRPNATVTVRTPIARNTDIDYSNIDHVLTEDVIVTLVETTADATSTVRFTISPATYHKALFEISDDRFDFDYRIHSSGTRGGVPAYYMHPIYAKPGAYFGDQHVTLTISARSGAHLDEIDHPALSAYLAGANGTVIFRDPGLPNVGFANHSQNTETLLVPVAPQIELLGAASLVVSSGTSDPTGLSVRVAHGSKLGLSWAQGFEAPDFNSSTGAPGTFGVNVLWQFVGYSNSGTCGVFAKELELIARDDEHNSVGATVKHTISMVAEAPSSVAAGDTPYVTGNLTLGFLAPGTLAADLPTGLSVNCIGTGFDTPNSNGLAVTGSGATRALVITAGHVVPDDEDSILLSVVAHNGTANAAATLAYRFAISTTIAIHRPDDISFSNDRPTLALGTNVSLRALRPGRVAASLRVQSRGDDFKFVRTEPLLAGTHFSLTLRSGDVATEFTIATELYNTLILGLDDDRVGYDFGDLRKDADAANYHAAGFFIKEGVELPPRQITLTLNMRSGAYVSEIEHAGLSAYLAANPAAELVNPGVRGPSGTPVRFRLTATSQFAITLQVGPTLVVSGAPRRLDMATITGLAGTGVTVRMDYDRPVAMSLSPGVALGAGNELMLDPLAEGLERIAGDCGEDVAVATVAVSDKDSPQIAALRDRAVFSITVYDAQAIGGGQVPAIASGPTARLEAGSELAAAVPTGFAFDCAGGSFEASFSNDAFALAGTAPSFSVLIKRGAEVPAGASALTTEINYRQNARAPFYQTSLTVLVGGSIALSPPPSLPNVPAASRPTVEFSGQPTPIEAGEAYAAAARLHAAAASYRNMDAFLDRNLDLTVYSGSGRNMTNYFEIAASLYNSRLVEFSDDRFGADARGVFIKRGARFDAAPLTLTLTLNSGRHLGELGHSGLDALIAAGGVLEARDPAVSGNGFALTASSVIELPLRVRPIVAVSGAQAALDAAATGFTDTGLRVTASYGAALARAVRPDLFALGQAGVGGHAISIDLGRLAEARARNEGCGIYSIDGTASFHPVSDAGAAKEAAFAVTLYDQQRIRQSDRPTLVGFQSVALDGGTLTADFDTGLGFECAAAEFEATFTGASDLTLADNAVNGRYAILLKSGAVLPSDENLVALARVRQESGAPEHVFTLTLRVNQSIAINPPATLPPVAPADLPRIEAGAALAIQPGQAYAARTYLHEADETARFFNIGRFRTGPFVLTIRELDGGATIDHAFTIAADEYNGRLVAGFSDERFGIDFADAVVDGDGGQRVRGIYIRPGAVFTSEALTLSITLNSGAYPSQLPNAALSALLARGGDLSALLPGVPDLNLSLTASAVVELPLRISPSVSASGEQLSIDATLTRGVVDTGLRLRAVYNAPLNATASPDVFVFGVASGGVYPLRMDMSRLAAAPQNYDSCGDFAVPGTATFEVLADASLRSTQSFSVTLFDQRKIRANEVPELSGAATVTLQKDAILTEPLATGIEFDCVGPNFSLRSTPDIFGVGADGPGARRPLQLKPITLTTEARELTAQIVYSQGGAATYTANITIEVLGAMATIQAHANRLAREVARASSGNMLRSVNKRIDGSTGGGSGLGLDRAAADELLRMLGNKEKELEEGGANLQELLAGQDFALPLAANGSGAPGASLWGQANVYSLDREADEFSYDGSLFSGLLGFDYRAGGVLFGLVAGHHSGEFTQVKDDDPSVFANDMQTLAPYFAFDVDGGGRVLAMAGAGAGELVVSNKADDEEIGRTDTSLVFYSIGYSQDLGLENGRLLFKGDFAGNELSVEGDPELSYDEADNSIWQLRVALEIARGITQGPVRLEPSLELAARLDIQDDDLGPTEKDVGYEAILGLEYDAGGRLHGRVDASLVKLGDDLQSFGLGLGVRFSPGAGQLGLGFDLEPRYGALATSGSLYDEDATLEELRAQLANGTAAPGLTARSSLRYGFGLPGRVAAPYLTYRLHEETADYVMGIRIHRGGAERWTMSYAPHEDGLMQLRYRLGQ